MESKKGAKRPTKGGVWDKLGNRFETRWTVNALAELLDGRADSVWLEPRSEEGIEFRLTRARGTEHHQCKRQLASTSDWHLHDLALVLEDFATRLRADPVAVCVFASTFSAATLANLCLHAALSPSSAAFDTDLAQSWRPSLRQLERIWHCSDTAETWQMLLRVRVATITEDLLVDLNQTRLRVLVGGENAIAAAAVLFEYVYEHTTQVVSADSLWKALSDAGIRRLELGHQTLARVEAIRRGFLDRLSELAIPGVVLNRTEASSVISELEANTKTVLVIGDAGVGKSHALAEVASECSRRGWQWLPVSLDTVGPATTSAQLGRHLELDASPADVIAQLQGDRHVLVLDQLDAISATSGRQLSGYDAIRDLLADTEAHQGVQVVVACRRFDYESDDRLRAMMDRTHAVPITVQPLEPSEVNRIVDELGFNASRLGDSQLRLLSSPLHLYLLSQVRGEMQAEQFDFSTEDDLYGLYWTRKRRDTDRKLGLSAAWTEVIGRLVHHLNRNRRLWAPVEILDDDAASAQAMASEHVLVMRNDRASFFHETFFDYCFARQFSTANGEGLVRFLLAHDQELFRRAQVRAALIHLRRADRQRYLDELEKILTDSRIRFHIKHVVASLLQTLDDPTEGEWERLKPLMQGPQTPISDRLVRMMREAPQWQEHLLNTGWLEEQLAGDPAAQFRGVNVAVALLRRRPDLVSPILLRHLNDGDPWPNVLRAIVGNGGQLGTDRSYFETVLRLIEVGILDEPYFGMFRTDVWNLAYGLAHKEPEWACELLKAVIQRQIVAPNADRPSLFDDVTAQHGAEELISQAASGAPLAFARHLVAVMLEAMASHPTEARPGKLLRRDTVWRFRLQGKGYGASARLLKAMESALQAIVDLKEFDALRDQLEASGLETANYLLARAYAHAGPARATEAIGFLAAVPERLELSLDGNRGTAASEVIRKASPIADPHVHRHLIRQIQRYEQDVDDEGGRSNRDRLQFRLLSAVAPRRRGPAGNGRLRDLRQSFGLVAPPSPVEDDDSINGRVHTPLPPEGVEQFTDAEWINTILTHPATSYWTKDNRLMGGAYELANIFEQQFDLDPTRFATILLQLPDNARIPYFEAGMRAAAKKVEDLDDATLWSIVRTCNRLPSRPLGRSVTWLIQAAASRQVPDDIVGIVEHYATDDPDPDESESPGDSSQSRPNLLESGMNSARGAAAEAMRALLRFHPELFERLELAVRRLATDPVNSVRACAAGLLNVVLHHHASVAFELIPALGKGDIGVLGTPHARQLLINTTRIDYPKIAESVNKMANSGDDGAGFAAGEVWAVRALLAGDDSVHLASHPSAAVRRGAAAVYAGNVSNAEYTVNCSRELIRLFSDGEEAVREIAAGCFRHLSAAQLIANSELSMGFARSQAYGKHSHFLLRKLAETPGAPVETMVEAAYQFIRHVGLDAGDIRQGAAADASDVSVMLIRAYSQNPKPAVRKQALDAIDRMLEVGAFGVDESIESYQR